MTLNRLRENFLRENKGKNITLIFANGFQMRGRLIDYDEKDVLIDTAAYASPPVTIQQVSVNAFIPTRN